MPKLTRKERRAARRRQRLQEAAEPTPASLSSEELAFWQAIQRERTSYPTEEGYHFIRPAWHAWVYGGGKNKG